VFHDHDAFVDQAANPSLRRGSATDESEVAKLTNVSTSPIGDLEETPGKSREKVAEKSGHCGDAKGSTLPS
jgi:hypothetical protein